MKTSVIRNILYFSVLLPFFPTTMNQPLCPGSPAESEFRMIGVPSRATTKDMSQSPEKLEDGAIAGNSWEKTWEKHGKTIY